MIDIKIYRFLLSQGQNGTESTIRPKSLQGSIRIYQITFLISNSESTILFNEYLLCSLFSTDKLKKQTTLDQFKLIFIFQVLKLCRLVEKNNKTSW